MKTLFKVLLVFLGMLGWWAVWQEHKISENSKMTIYYNEVLGSAGDKELNIEVGDQLYTVGYPFNLGSDYPNEYSKTFTLYWYGGSLVDNDYFVSKDDYKTRWPDSAVSVTFWLYISDDYNRPRISKNFYRNYKLVDSEYPLLNKCDSKSKFAYEPIINNENINMIFCRKNYEESSTKPACSATVHVGKFAKVQIRFPPKVLAEWGEFKSELNSVFKAISYI